MDAVETEYQRYTEFLSAVEDDWDLHAVVRGCNASTMTSISSVSSSSSVTSQAFASDSSSSCFSVFSGEKNGRFFSIQDPFGGRNNEEELHELGSPFFLKSPVSEHPPPHSSPVTAVSPFSLPVKSKAQTYQEQSGGGSVTTPRTKRRKNQMKRVCQVASESLSSDIWAWRKYGQKPIKGSPYPRGYYRCSSSKGCLARRQVERNRSDPEMFIVTYTAEHNHPAPTHRNTLAGSTRQKPGSSPEPNKIESGEPNFSSSPSSEDIAAPPCATAESKEENDDLVEIEEDDFGASEMIFDDVFAVRFKELDSPATDDYLYENFPAKSGSPWTGRSQKTVI